MQHVLGVDLGGTLVKAGVVAADGTMLSMHTMPSGERGGPAAWAEAALEAGRRALDAADARPIAIGLSVPGAVDARRTTLLDMAARLPTAAVDLAALFARFGLPVRAENDANAALAAERRWGGHGDVEDLVLLTIGTGIGSSVVVGGQPLARRPLAGNLAGHLTIDRHGSLCICGNRGCGETLASATALVEAARQAGLAVSGAAEVFDAEARGDTRAAGAIATFLDALASIVVNVVHAYQPEVVILSGGVMASADRILPALRDSVTDRAWIPPGRTVRLVPSDLGPQGPVLGAAAIALEGDGSDRGLTGH